MATKRTPKKQNQPLILQTVKITQIQRTTQDIKKWRNALQAAESTTNPSRKLLYDLYYDLLLDAQLINTTNTRRRKITNSKFRFVRDGEEVPEVQELIESPLFFNMLSDIIDSRFWGFSLLEFYKENDELKYYLAPRKHVKPEKNIVTVNAHDQNGLDFTKPPLSNYVLAAGNPADLGLYLAAAQYVLYKRGCFGDWAQFVEIFGMPFRWSEYDGTDQQTRQKIEQALETMGSAAYGVFPQGAAPNIEQNNQNGNGEVYEKLYKASDEQISLIMLGQTMTTKDGSSLSQAKVHADVAEQVFIDDRRFILNTLNYDFVDILETFGFPADGEFQFVDETKINLKDRIYIDTQIAEHVPVPDQHWFETYGIEMPENYEQAKEKWLEQQRQVNMPQNMPQPNEAGAQEPVKQQSKRVPMAAIYQPEAVASWSIPFIAASKNNISRAEWKKMQDEAKRLAQLIYNGSLPNDYYVSETMVNLIAEHLQKAVLEGYGNIAAGTADIDTLQQLNRNIYQFSAAKNYNQLRDMNAALLNADGTRRSLNDFNKAVEQMNIEYNRNWQATEYNTAQSSAQMARKWNQFQEEAEAVPMLKWVTVGDERVRESHRRLDGMTAPATDPIWLRYWPPIDWNDRCDVIQITMENAVRNLPPDEEMPNVPKGFGSNPGASGKIFDTEHSYFKGVPDEVAEQIFKF